MANDAAEPVSCFCKFSRIVVAKGLEIADVIMMGAKHTAKSSGILCPSRNMIVPNPRQEQKPANNFEKLHAGMTAEECKSICGEPDKISKQVYSNRVVEFWDYKNPKGTLHFRNGLLSDFSFDVKQ